jgi:hypothetical protein
VVAFRFRVAEVLPPGDAMTAPTLRLEERLADPAERHRALGDFLYATRLLFSGTICR